MWLFFPAAIIGWASGIIVNYLSDYLPHYRRLVFPVCVHCGNKIPLIDYLFWPRKCPTCHQTRSRRVYLVEALYIVFTVAWWLTTPHKLSLISGTIILIYFGVVAVIDFEHRLIIHPVSVTGAILGLMIGYTLHGFTRTILGGLIGFGIMFVLYLLGFILIRFRRGKNVEIDEALGFGDVNLGGVIGLFLGWPGVIVGLVTTIFLAGGYSLVYLIVMLIKKKYRSDMAIAYGPFLVLGALIILFH